WISAFVLVLLVTGLPWTDVWGRAFQTVRDSAGWVKGAPSWSINGSAAAAPQAHASHDHGAMHPGDTAPAQPDAHAHAHAGAWAPAPGQWHRQLARLDDPVARAWKQTLAFPTMVLAPGEVLFAPPTSDWTVTSLTQNRPLGMTITYGAADGTERSREAF